MMTDAVPTSRDSFATIAIVGVGLLGGSIAAALRQRGYQGEIVGVGRDPGRLEAARSLGLIDRAATAPAEAAPQSDLMIFCTPVDRIADGVREAARHCRPGTLLTDVGSVKGTICAALAGRLPDGVTFIGSHPLAGSEKQGFEHADPNLFEGRICVVTPDASTPAGELDLLRRFWKSLGLWVVEMPCDAHDRALAQTSHLPHVVAAALASSLSESNRRLAATGFRDTTRIASGDPDLWVGILLGNAGAVETCLDEYAGRIAEFRDAIAARDAARLKMLLETAKTNRDAVFGGPSVGKPGTGA